MLTPPIPVAQLVSSRPPPRTALVLAAELPSLNPGQESVRSQDGGFACGAPGLVAPAPRRPPQPRPEWCRPSRPQPALQISLIFSKEDGLLAFIHKSLSTEERVCLSVYIKDKSAKCRIPALELLIKVKLMLNFSMILYHF
ncbi:hypothetical protein JD844_016256 [Phrynosoma platyrhinos]|uniref:Uncharacterized protein n=1 Tax=Phrynosoma platyrhinos TaxID=52577 RepID=A0ABQ7SK58_PHRPL|nr:hypothetical protein JD844_016256 [Phrynosoma platyrhinos]